MAPGLPGETRSGITASNLFGAIVSFDVRCSPCPCGIAHHGDLDRAEGVVRLDLQAQPESREGNVISRKLTTESLLPLFDRAYTRLAAYRNGRRCIEGSCTPP